MTPIRTTGFRGRPLAVLDLEMTGLDPKRHHICEISILRPDDGTIDLPVTHFNVVGGWRAYSWKVWPLDLSTAEPEALEMNGFDEDQWKVSSIGLPRMLSYASQLLDEVTLVGHNVYTDMRFLEEAARRCGRDPINLKYRIDTTSLIWSDLVPLGLTRGNLAEACTALGISNLGQHQSLVDVKRTLMVMHRIGELRGDSRSDRLFRKRVSERIEKLERQRRRPHVRER